MMKKTKRIIKKPDKKNTVFGIIGNTNKIRLAGVACSLVKEFEKKKVEYCVDKNLAHEILTKCKIKIKPARKKSIKDIVDCADFVISIGGDGTFLATAKHVGNRGVPIIGVNLGKLGFLAETPPSKISIFINDILNKKYKVEERTVLEAKADILHRKKIYGLNEIVINQSGTVKTIELQAYYNGQMVISYLADGLVVSTPTGSTGYSLSAGGPIVRPGTGVIVLAPICPHTLTSRPIILPDSGVIKIKVVSKVPVIITADGNSRIKFNSAAFIEIKKAHYKIKLAKQLGSNYFRVLNRKLLWGVDVRKNSKTKS